jgi:pimeloyl-ACP methyl ester carboxylesterase
VSLSQSTAFAERKGLLVLNDRDIPLEYQSIDNGGTNIVFLNGFRMLFKTWDKVYPELTSEHSVLLFNRKSVGASSKATEVQDGRAVVSEIRSLFSYLRLSPPYVFVAHSLGGL